jgi:Ca2+-binding RTX toxin-like protein
LNDTLFGTPNNDTVDLLSGADLYYGLDGDDSILADRGRDTVFGGDGADTIVGANIGFLDGGAGNDVLIADSFFDTPLAGGAGDDRYIMSGFPPHFINDSSGNDTLSFAEVERTEVLVPYLSGVAGIEAFDLSGGVDILHLDGASVRSLSDTDVVTVFGGGADRLVLDDLASWTRGEASGGFVTFTTAIGGNATVIAAESLVPITSEPTTGNETLFGSQDDDVVNLLAGNDFYRDFSGRDSVLGGSGNDTIWGGADEDTLDGGEGNDIIFGENNDSLEGGSGDDFLLSGSVYESGSGYVFRMSGGAGNDYIYSEGLGDTLDGGIGDDTIIGIGQYFSYGAGSDSILGGDGNDKILAGGGSTIVGGEGDDSLSGGEDGAVFDGGAGSDFLWGYGDNDVAVYSDARTAYRFSLNNGDLIVTGPTGTDRLRRIESLRFGSDAPIEVSSLGSMNLIEETVAVSRGGVTTGVLAERYSGPVSWLEYQVLGIDGGDVMSGTSRNDFFNLLGGDDAANGGHGDDVLDGGSGSNFLTGGTGRDDFFLDGRGGAVTWATITDWQATERLSVWGWRPGVSTVQWVDSAGAPGYTGVTMHGDLDGNGVIDTSVTWTGMTAAQLPTPLEYEGLLWFA